MLDLRFKFFTILFFGLLVSLNVSAQQLHLTKGPKSKKVKLNRDVEFYLHSDTSLGIEYKDFGKLVSYTDSSLVMESGREVELTDIKRITFLPKYNKKAKIIASTFATIGLGLLIRGSVMAAGEGLESRNATIAPPIILIGAITTGISSIPFLGKRKSYDIGAGGWEFSF